MIADTSMRTTPPASDACATLRHTRTVDPGFDSVASGCHPATPLGSETPAEVFVAMNRSKPSPATTAAGTVTRWIVLLTFDDACPTNEIAPAASVTETGWLATSGAPSSSLMVRVTR